MKIKTRIIKSNTIKWKIFSYNIIVIVILISVTTIVFNLAIRWYIEKDIVKQLENITDRAEHIILNKGPDFFQRNNGHDHPRAEESQDNNKFFRFYFVLDRALREPLSVLSANYILLDDNDKVIMSPKEESYKPPKKILSEVIKRINYINKIRSSQYIDFTSNGTKYIGIIKSVSTRNSLGLHRIIVYASVQKVNQLQFGINMILFFILILSSLIISIFSSVAAKKISAPFSSLNKHISEIAERKFGSIINTPVDNELKELVNNINIMSEKLEKYDRSQKTFLQNVSHEFRTPLMCIQSYAEGIKHNVTDGKYAADIILSETTRMTRLVEDLLYLSRLDAIHDDYKFRDLYVANLIKKCVERMNSVATKYNVKITLNPPEVDVLICADEEKLFRAIGNILDNCLRYAKTCVNISLKVVDSNKIEIIICDDGQGIETSEIKNIFERFYKGKKGNFGLGLAISKNIIEKHGGFITAGNTTSEEKPGAIFKICLPLK